MQIYFYSHPYIGDIKDIILLPVFHILYCESLFMSIISLLMVYNILFPLFQTLLLCFKGALKYSQAKEVCFKDEKTYFFC